MLHYDNFCLAAGFTKQQLQAARLPLASDELAAFAYLACRMAPAPQRYLYDSVAEADAELRKHRAWHSNLRLETSNRTDIALNLCLLTMPAASTITVNPFTVSLSNGND